MDGNFVSNQKDKRRDLQDFPLTRGAAYFVDEKDVEIYNSKLGPLKIEVRFPISCRARPDPTDSTRHAIISKP